MFRVKRVYDKPDGGGGVRILVDRLWPRGLRREDARIDDWLKDIAPSGELRSWFGHREERWPEFESRYHAELEKKKEAVGGLKKLGGKRKVTLLYAARDTEKNNAQALLEFIKKIR